MMRKRSLETQLNALYDRKSKGAQIRSRAKLMNEAEKNKNYFIGLEKKALNTKRNLRTTE